MFQFLTASYTNLRYSLHNTNLLLQSSYPCYGRRRKPPFNLASQSLFSVSLLQQGHNIVKTKRTRGLSSVHLCRLQYDCTMPASSSQDFMESQAKKQNNILAKTTTADGTVSFNGRVSFRIGCEEKRATHSMCKVMETVHVWF